MSVVNVKIKYTHCNLKEWMSDENNIYIGRGRIVFIDGQRFPKSDSIFANPFKIHGDNRDQVIDSYRTYFYEKIKDDDFRKEVLKLKGKNLGCWCKPFPCHGDIIAEYLKLI